jgi:hypothetical protein
LVFAEHSCMVLAAHACADHCCVQH